MSKLNRVIAVLLTLCLMGSSAWAEEFIGENTDGFGETTEDGLRDFGENVTNTDEYYVQTTINTDADVVMGYTAASGAAINPLFCNERDIVSLNRLVFESVVDLDSEYKPTPLLADSWSCEGKTWTFNLRKGVVFHNGAELTAADVYLTWQRFLYDGQNSPYYARLALISNMVVKDTYTLEVSAAYSGYITLYGMTFPVIQSSTLSDSMPRGTGPYWFTEYAPGFGFRMEKNPLWWKNDAKIQSIAAIRYDETSDGLEALQMNEINMYSTQSNKAALYRKLSNLTNMDYATNKFEVMIPNLSTDSYFSDLRMRQAVMYAIDRAAITENAYGGMGVQCEVPVNPGSWLYDSQSAVYYYSPERALQLVYDCGWNDLTGDGYMNKIDGVLLLDLKINIITYNEPTNSVREHACNIIAGYLKTIGINAEVTVYSKEDCMKRIKNKKYDIALVGIELSDVPNLAPMLGRKGSININDYNNEDMNNLLGQISSTTTEEGLKSIYSQIQMMIVERLPIMGLLFRTGTLLSRQSLSGLNGIRASNVLNGFEFVEQPKS